MGKSNENSKEETIRKVGNAIVEIIIVIARLTKAAEKG